MERNHIIVFLQQQQEVKWIIDKATSHNPWKLTEEETNLGHAILLNFNSFIKD
jgi:hypothetical protein